MSDYQAFRVELLDKIAHVSINRPHKANAMNADFWREIVEIFRWVDATPAVRVVVLSGVGEHFSAGIDLQLLAQLTTGLSEDAGRNADALRQRVVELQAAFTAVDNCRKPVLAAIHGYCLGAGVDLISACDMRYATTDAQFSIKEVDLGMAADVGTLQRLPQLIGDAMLRELAYTARQFDGVEAQRIGLLNRTFSDAEALLAGVLEIASEIASKSPLAVRGTKHMIRYARDHRVSDGLEYIATWNAAMLQSDDLRLALAAQLNKQKAEFAD